jgi:hypothetical protein
MRREYDDIINLPHHVSATRPHMPISDRAAQFSPFAALTGYDAVIRETARRTDEKIELDEDAKDELNARINQIQARIGESPEISVIYFIPDAKKAGGRYATVAGAVQKIDEFGGILVMRDKTRIPIGDILEIALC